MDINKLNDDCLLEIFKYFSKLDRLRASLVCKKWAIYLVKQVDIDDHFVRKYYHDYHTTKNLKKFLENILIKTGSYVNICNMEIYQSITFNKIKCMSDIINLFAKYCKNITNLNLSCYRWCIENIDLLFKNNTNLRCLRLTNLYFDGKCLSKLNTENIQEIEISSVEDFGNYLIKILSKLKNVKKVCISSLDGIDVIRALLKSECECIEDFSLTYLESQLKSVNKLLTLLLRQKKLKKINLYDLEINESFLDQLKKDYLETLEISLNENFSYYSFIQFKHLRVLICEISRFTDNVMKGISECTSLKELSIHVHPVYLLSEIGEKYFSKMLSLEIFNIYTNVNIDNILIALSHCENLKTITIQSSCKYTKVGMNALSSLPNLRDLNISGTDVTDELLINLVKKASKLEKLNILHCVKLTNRFVEAASEVKQHRNDKHYLAITYLIMYEEYDKTFNFDTLRIIPEDLKNISPLILFKTIIR